MQLPCMEPESRVVMRLVRWVNAVGPGAACDHPRWQRAAFKLGVPACPARVTLTSPHCGVTAMRSEVPLVTAGVEDEAPLVAPGGARVAHHAVRGGAAVVTGAVTTAL